jgi:outer membrane PBP1 activator LpoA protein
LALSFGKSRDEDVVALIAARKYGRAIEVLKAQLSKRGASHTVRKQLADVLVMAGKTSEAIALLLPLADEFARDGFAAKAVSVLKKVQKLDPSRRDVEPRLARLIEEKQREAVLPFSLPDSTRDRGDAGPAPGEPSSAAGGPSLEIGFEMAPISAPAEAPAPAPPRPEPQPRQPPPASPAPSQEPAIALPTPEPPLPLPAPVPVTPAPRPLEPPTPPAEPAARSLPADTAASTRDEGIEDYDLLYAAEDDEEEIDVPVELPAEGEAMSDGQFADELMSLVDSVFQEFKTAAPAAPAAPVQGEARSSGSQIVVSPLFRDFSVDEMVAVIQGLRLLTFERGEVILHEGQPGTSLYTLTSGRVRAFRKDTSTGKQSPLADLKEGAFFGEISILTGQPRNASVVALTRCELLELDRPALDQITRTHPHVWDVIREFAGRRGVSAGR